mgnify:FL=1
MLKKLIILSSLLFVSSCVIRPVTTSRPLFPLVDDRLVVHKYWNDIHIPRHKKRVIVYCATHFQWEVVKRVYTPKRGMKWRVNKHKRGRRW